MKTIYIICTLFAIGFITISQIDPQLHKIEPNESYDNIYVKKIADDTNQTTFLIWIKKEVALHYHQDHTENIYIIEGKGKMTLGDNIYNIEQGNYFNIPPKTPHSVVVTSKKPLKVLSIQSPKFDGTDRILISQP